MASFLDALRYRGIRDERVLQAMASLDRRRFVPPEQAANADFDAALPIGHEQTISQPFVVALMTEALALRGDERVLEIGTGSGYQTAVLSALAREVYSIEIVPELHARARAVLVDELGLQNVHLRRGDGYAGWPEAAPFDAIILTAAPERIPTPLIEQLAIGGRMIAPVGAQDGEQELVLVRRIAEDDVVVEKILGVRFVPMTRENLAQ
ncbi:MAG: protein-L-isoaspartate(D-aspartate) O-methyltransferase [Myxococcaceae bacterium]|nr:protein-L-isoaspartate(D-aspartate) O-methyltransferase [Myxococcaceae bacterium]